MLSFLIVFQIFLYSAIAANYVSINNWGSVGSSPSLFNAPSDVAFNPNEEAVYVSDLENNRIQKFDSKGNYIFN